MNKKRESNRFQVPLMYAFREAFEAGDSRKLVEERLGGERVVTSRASLARRGTDEVRLKRNLVIDLLALVNTVDLGSAVDLSDMEWVRQSVLNFGLPDITHLTSDEEGVDDIAKYLADALLQHEPRLDPDSLVVTRDEFFDDVEQRVRFRVSADMACRPADVPIDFVAEIDISSGKVLLSRLPVTS
ncbi:GPW/gp25 family protein [Chelativorans sp. AA-79]|uniref:type VI secretion system baseplate subunit TssE n=1 Tax=Chelativorans sp. AA-79 TaxID=3028735 RepID=UPI0023F74ACF|nr:GPW/gp25 family protein [Chelativorans sp. AA-79]WEX10872.1 GPW/gp25 family protein [Chelativorans sp. AA-79]